MAGHLPSGNPKRFWRDPVKRGRGLSTFVHSGSAPFQIVQAFYLYPPILSTRGKI
jgi:hypothetical protein